MKRMRQSLNGLWTYCVNGKDMGFIRVPFSARCVGDSVCACVFDARIDMLGASLCFEGIAYLARVTLNGVFLGEIMPYSFYAFDVTGLLRATGNVLEVALRDRSGGHDAHLHLGRHR